MNEEQNNQSVDSKTSLQKVHKSPEMRSAVIDYVEITIDKLVESDNEIFDKIPILKTILAGVAFRKDVVNRFFEKKLARFLNSFSDDNEDIKVKIENALPNQKDKEEMADHLLIYLQRFEQLKKADILFKLFLARIYEIISPTEFDRLSIALDRIDLYDINIFKQFYEDDNSHKALNDPKSLKRDEKAKWDEHRVILRSLVNVKLVAVDYSGRPKSGQLYPRYDGGGEAFERNSLGQQFIKVLNFNPKQET